MSDDFSVQLATRFSGWSAGGLLSVFPCVVSFSKFHEPDTHDCCGQVASILVASSSYTSDFLVTCQRRPREDFTMLRGKCSRAISALQLIRESGKAGIPRHRRRHPREDIGVVECGLNADS